ncbi:hypothetical protein [Qipengyuania sp. RANM35]|uniref:hypothetical protein n=1 Tax=Qipengyuania sp. RANM35 TaxID=3068635 RepID=UPI0034DADCB8
MSQGVTIAMALMLASCTTTPGEGIAVNETPDRCIVDGASLAGLDHDTICSVVRQEFRSAGGSDAMGIAIAIVSDRQAHGRLLDADGQEVATLTLDISDATLNETAFRHFGGSLAQVAQSKTDKST